MAEHLRLINTTADPPPIADFAMTDTAADILRTLRLVRGMGGASFTKIAGAPGVGKTKTLRQFEAEAAGDVMLHTVAAGEGKPFNIASALFRRWWPDFEVRGQELSAVRSILARWIGKGRVLIIDEAQGLEHRSPKSGTSRDALDWLRALAEEGEFALVLCGDLALEAAVGHMPQLQSRLDRPVIVRRATARDVAAVAALHGLTDPKALAILTAAAGFKGGLRNVARIVRLARMFAGEGPVEPSHLAAAAAEHGLAPGKGSAA